MYLIYKQDAQRPQVWGRSVYIYLFTVKLCKLRLYTGGESYITLIQLQWIKSLNCSREVISLMHLGSLLQLLEPYECWYVSVLANGTKTLFAWDLLVVKDFVVVWCSDFVVVLQFYSGFCSGVRCGDSVQWDTCQVVKDFK